MPQGDGVTCTNIDECAADTHLCLSDVADCHDSEGSYSCECRDGYQGDGKINCTGTFLVNFNTMCLL